MKAKRIVGVLLCAVMIVLMLPVTAQAGTETVGDFVVDTEVASGYTYSGNILKFTSPGSYSLSMKSGVTTTANDRIQIEGGTESNPIILTLNTVSVSTWDRAIFIANSSYVRLNLAAGTTNTMTGGAWYGGIVVPSAATLVIGGTGTLIASGGEGAGIGVSGGVVYDGNDSSGTIMITGGTINAQGSSYFAGIGSGGVHLDCGTVIISGGNVTATGGTDAPGIGAGYDAATLTGGTAENITISSGMVIASGSGGGAGIGSGSYGSATVNISGGNVTATGSGGGAGIGCGYRGTGATVNISGGTVIATGGSSGGAGIGGGYYGTSTTVSISNGSVSATGNGGGAGIGGGSMTDSGSVTITNGTVTAEGAGGSAGIGGGYQGYCDSVAINGGTVTATGSIGGAGIGDGSFGAVICHADIVIAGGSVKATGGTGAEDIGRGGGSSTGGSLTNGAANGSQSVYLATVTLQGAADAAAVTSLISDAGYSYGCSGIKTNATGIIYIYLPTGAEITAAVTGGGTYTGSVTTTSDHLAAGTLTIQSYIQLATPKNLDWDTTVHGKATWGAVANASGYSVQLYKGGVAQGSAVSASGTEYDFTAAVAAAGNDTYTFTVSAVGDGTDYLSSGASAVSPGYFYSDPLITTSATLPSASLGEYYSFTFAAEGTTPVTWSFVSGYIPLGLTLSADGVLSGTPLSAYQTSFVLKAVNAKGEMQKEFTIRVVNPSELPYLAISSTLAWDGATGKATWSAVDHASGYSVQLYKDGSAEGSAVTVSSGLEYDFMSRIAAAGSGSYTFSVTALGDNISYQDGLSSGQSDDAYVYTAPATEPVITLMTLPNGTVDMAYSQTFTAMGTAPVEWSITAGALPSGLTLSTAGALSGTPSTAGTYSFTVTAENSAGSDSRAFTVTIALSNYGSRTLTDSATGITVSGEGIHKDAVLTVGAISLHESGTCDACDAIRDYMADDAWTLVLGKDISLSYGFIGTLTITIPVGADYNGKTVTILHDANGTLQTVTSVVADGKAVITVTSLSPFAVFSRTELTLTSSDSDGTIYVGGRLTLTPNIAGGEWDFDSAYLSRGGNTFTGLQTGTTTVTYTVSGVSVSYDVIIEQTGLPSTGQNYTWAWVLAVLAACAAAAARMHRKRIAA